MNREQNNKAHSPRTSLDPIFMPLAGHLTDTATFTPLAILGDGCDHPYITAEEAETLVTAHLSRINQLIEEGTKIQTLVCLALSLAGSP